MVEKAKRTGYNFDAQANKTPSCIGNRYHETPAAALNLPAADAKLVAIVTGAAGPEASSPTASNSTAQYLLLLLLIPQHKLLVLELELKADGAVSGPPGNRLLSAHFLS